MSKVLASLLALAATAASAAVPFVDLTAGFVPYANDVPVMVGLGVRLADRHELFGRFAWMPTGDDVRHAFGVVGFREVFRPGLRLRPFVGAIVAGLPSTCGHDALGRPDCTSNPLFIISATGGVRYEPVRWFGLSAALLVGVDTYPNPFGMVELGATFFWPFGS